MHLKRALPLAAVLLAFGSHGRAGVKDRHLDVYWIDVEGGAATLIVTPAGESVLVDAGNPGQPGTEGRDPARILRVASQVAGLQQIDDLVVTHFHVDHFGGAAELAERIPVGVLFENPLDQAPERERNDPALGPYRAIKVRRRVVIEPDLEIRLAGIVGTPVPRLRFLGSRQRFVAPLEPVRRPAACAGAAKKDPDTSDNANSAVLLLEFGPFRLFDGGDLTWNVEEALVCPVDRVGPVDVYQSDHHGLDQSNNPVLVRTLQPTVVVFNNGPRKGAGPETVATVRTTPSVKAVYQIHRNLVDDRLNTDAHRIANPGDPCRGDYVALSVAPEGASYSVSVPSTKHRQTFRTRVR
ncbi:MAG TPA: MBL fold metallo-hydrolase [Vicinamibacteria bacterium]|nr:MBL fold metallo-hydrolase [Vicinamibacteria bacterium]